MANKITEITSTTHFQTTLSSNTYVVADFYADWCGPCKAIAPLFAQLAAAEAKPGRMAFVKVNVDSQQGVARAYGVSAMPTFLILKNGTVTQTIRGADPTALRTAITTASSAASTGPVKPSPAFSSSGRTLGSTSSSSPSSSGASYSSSATSSLRNAGNAAMAFDAGGQVTAGLVAFVRAADSIGMGGVARFVVLYLWTLFSLDPEGAAATSPFKVKEGGVRAR